MPASQAIDRPPLPPPSSALTAHSCFSDTLTRKVARVITPATEYPDIERPGGDLRRLVALRASPDGRRCAAALMPHRARHAMDALHSPLDLSPPSSLQCCCGLVREHNRPRLLAAGRLRGHGELPCRAGRRRGHLPPRAKRRGPAHRQPGGRKSHLRGAESSTQLEVSAQASRQTLQSGSL